MPVALFQAVGPAGRSGSKLRRASEISLSTPGLDLSSRLRVFQRALRSRVERRDALIDIVRAVNVTLEPHKIAEVIVERAATWVPAPCWAVVSADLSGELSVLADRGLTPDMGPAIYAIAEWVMQRGQEFVTADLTHDTRVTDPSVGAVVAFPLGCRGRRVGALVALDRQPSAREPQLAPSMLRAVRMLLEPASVALDNALLLKRAEALSVTDDLTHLYNSRYLNLVLRRETKRASRSGRPLSLLFIDLDGFKTVNDTHGHLYGSRALVEAAAVIRNSARETDVVARFGGDEFALVLPDTGGEGAFAVGERIRERLAAYRFLAGDQLDIHLTASVGVATLPDVAASSEELMQAADKAMYAVKESGKNGIQAAIAPADT
ncbi:MAG TPA: sensor domain-containing diguanylate cyclase [Vicinamibacterales bacterium]|jgi:diguanylate cyclase (GGDEF)-like protein|nr:sensor domain-containing diguanylate cyclase [Vicinamibacterales bacterium]